MKKGKKQIKKKISKKRMTVKKEWSVNQFIDSVWETMEKQAEDNPAIKMVHARLEPEWNKVIQKISLLLEAKSESDVIKFTEEICTFGERAIRPLIDALLRLKSAVMTGVKEQCQETHNINE